jgi:phenylalanyl-tRNA synthetase alpha chain
MLNLDNFESCQTINECLSLKDEFMSIGRVAEIKKLLLIASNEEKRILGQELNQIKTEINIACNQRIQIIQTELEKDKWMNFDPTFYNFNLKSSGGNLHPVSLISDEIVNYFSRLGFDLAAGPWVENQYYGFTALNMPDYHPARGMTDSFYLNITDPKNLDLVLRSQTSSVQIRYGETHKPPIHVVVPAGRCFRNEDIDATHDIMFNQVECLVVDKKVSLAHLKSLLQGLFVYIFNDPDLKIRFRTSYFPFTKPSIEYDISCPFCGGNGCRVCKNYGWIEIGGGGLVHPNVIQYLDLDPKEYQGLAFGFGVERVAQFKLGVQGLGQFWQNDIGFLRGR